MSTAAKQIFDENGLPANIAPAVKQMTIREMWLAERRKGIGGSDAAAAAGISKWRTPYQLWEDKLGLSETLENAAMRWGKKLEPVVRAEYEEVTGRKVLQPQTIWSDIWPFALANIDGVTTCDRLVEIKTSRTADGWGEPGSSEIPIDYYAQVMHYMAVTGLPVCDVAVLIGSSDFRIYEIPSDQEAIELLMEAEAEFWRYVVTETPPPASSAEDVRRRWQKSVAGSIVTATEQIADAVRKLRAAKAKLADVEATCEELELFIKNAMGPAEAIVSLRDEVLVTWKSSKSVNRFDSKAFASDHPDLLAAYTRECPGSRRFLLKGLKDE